MTREPVGWVFNLDAEDELRHGGAHTPTAATRARVEVLLPILRALLEPGDEIVWPKVTASLSVRRGQAWCPTAWACVQLQQAGLSIAHPPPSPEILRRANHRAFAHELGQALPGARFVHSEKALVEALSDATTLAQVSMERNWLMKLPLGYAGRGRRKIATASFSAADRTWIQGALRSGDGIQVEPLVERERDCALHGWLAQDGNLTMGFPTVIDVDASGTWRSSRLAEESDLLPEERAALEQASRETGAALHRLGFTGPFGLDAFRWRAPDGEIHFQPRCEINARYSMGWAVGMRVRHGLPTRSRSTSR